MNNFDKLTPLTRVHLATTDLKLKRWLPHKKVLEEYGRSNRHYHNFNHIDDCLNLCASIHEINPHLTIALFYHDIVYNILASDNEIMSANIAKEDLIKSECNISDCIKIMELIKVTDHKTDPVDRDQELIADIDMAILGSDSKKYEEYSSSVRKEYTGIIDGGNIDEELYNLGRLSFLKGLLAKNNIYHTDIMFERFEKNARINIENELKTI